MGNFDVNGILTVREGTVVLPRTGGSASFAVGPVTVTFAVTGSTCSIFGGGLGVVGVEDVASCQGSAGGLGDILESPTSFSCGGVIRGIVTCTFDDGSTEDFPVTGFLFATAAK